MRKAASTESTPRACVQYPESFFLAGVTRSFGSFSEAATEAAMSRIYGGIHYRFASEDGMVAGVEIGDWVFEHALRPKGNRSRKLPATA